MLNWKNNFIQEFGFNSMPDLQQATKIKQSEYDLSKGVQDQAQKIRNNKQVQDIRKIIRGDF